MIGDHIQSVGEDEFNEGPIMFTSLIGKGTLVYKSFGRTLPATFPCLPIGRLSVSVC